MEKKSKISILKLFITTSFVLGFSFVLFATGAIWAKYKLPPYHFLRDTYDELIRYQFINYIQNKEAKTTLENIFPNANEVETDHLPLLLTKYDLGSIIKNPKFGGICSAGNLILGIGWQGEGYFINQETGLIKKINIRLPNSKELFASIDPGVAKVYPKHSNLLK